MKLEPVFKQHIVTPEFLSAIGARKMTLRARIWQDEVEAAEREFERILVRPFTLDQKGAVTCSLCLNKQVILNRRRCDVDLTTTI